MKKKLQPESEMETSLMMHHYTHREIRILENNRGKDNKRTSSDVTRIGQNKRMTSNHDSVLQMASKLQETAHCNRKATLQHRNKIQNTSLPPDDLRRPLLIASTNPRLHPYPHPRTKESGCQEKLLQPGSKTVFLLQRRQL